MAKNVLAYRRPPARPAAERPTHPELARFPRPAAHTLPAPPPEDPAKAVTLPPPWKRPAATQISGERLRLRELDEPVKEAVVADLSKDPRRD